MKILHSLLAVGVFIAASSAVAHSPQMHGESASPVKMEQMAWGIAGEDKHVVRTIEINMTDNMRFTPDAIRVVEGETIRFVHFNNGEVMHEFVLGTKEELEEHAALMKKFPNMEHDEPYMAHVEPGKQGEIIWHFNRAGAFDFACLLPGHYEAGMVGTIQVVARDAGN